MIYHKNTKFPQIDSTEKGRDQHLFGAGLAGFFHVFMLTIRTLFLGDAHRSDGDADEAFVFVAAQIAAPVV